MQLLYMKAMLWGTKQVPKMVGILLLADCLIPREGYSLFVVKLN